MVGSDTTVWAHAVIGAGAVIGRGCVIGHAAYVDRFVRLGDRVWVHNKASIYRPWELASDVFIGPHVVFVNDADPTPHTTRDLHGVVCRVEQGVTIGANATILNDLTLGAHSFIGAAALVSRDTEPYGIYAGSPARLRGYRCVCRTRFGLEAGLPEECGSCGRRF